MHRLARSRAKAAQPHRWVYRDQRWRHTRSIVLERDGYRCTHLDAHGVRCPARGSGLHAHHHPFDLVELLERGIDPFDPALVVTLCHRHHSEVTARRAAASRRSRRGAEPRD
jgi:hypothetical protein